MLVANEKNYAVVHSTDFDTNQILLILVYSIVFNIFSLNSRAAVDILFFDSKIQQQIEQVNLVEELFC